MSIDASTLNLTAIANYPAGIPPPGTRANYVNPPNHAVGWIITCGVLCGLMVLCLGARCYAKIWLIRRPGWDDVTCVVGVLATLTAYVGLTLMTTIGTFGYDQYNLRVGQMLVDINFQGDCIFVWAAAVAMLTIKCSLLITYYVIFGSLRWMRICVLSLGTAVIAASLGLQIAVIIFSTPAPHQPWVAHDIGEVTRLALPIGIVGLVTDVIILVMPLPAVWTLQMRKGRKVAVSLVFLAGILACAASAINVYIRVPVAHMTNITQEASLMMFITLIEYSIGACCACAPSLSALVHRASGPIVRPLRRRCWWPCRQRNAPETTKGTTISIPGPRRLFGRGVITIFHGTGSTAQDSLGATPRSEQTLAQKSVATTLDSSLSTPTAASLSSIRPTDSLRGDMAGHDDEKALWTIETTPNGDHFNPDP